MHCFRHIPARSCLAAFGLVALAFLAGCTPPKLPSLQPTVEEVPFLGQQLTQEQIAEWRDKVAQRRQAIEARHAAEKVECYQRFFVNRCIAESRSTYRMEASVLRKQDLELNRQERLLKEIDRQLRIQQNAQDAAAAAAAVTAVPASAPAPIGAAVAPARTSASAAAPAGTRSPAPAK